MSLALEKVVTPTAIGLSLLLVGCQMVLVRGAGEHESEVAAGRIIELGSRISDGQLMLFFIGAFVVFVMGVALLRKNQWVGAVPLALGIASLLGLFASSIDEGMNHQFAATWLSKDGIEFALLEESFLQGYELALVERVGHTGKKFKVLASATGNEGFGSLELVRPAGSKLDDLRIISRGKLLLATGGSHLWLAYDLKNRLPYGDLSTQKGEVVKVSPFLLLGPADKPNKTDFLALMDPNSIGRPPEDAIEPDLKNPNPQVREMAKELLKSVKGHPPQIQ